MKSKIENLEKALSLPYGVIDRGARIVLFSNREAVVEGCKAITEYDQNSIVLSLGKKYIKFNGESLNVASYEKNNAVIQGKFDSLEFE